MKKLIATAAFASLLALTGCAQEAATSSGGDSSESVASALASSQLVDTSASAEQSTARSGKISAAGSAASAGDGAVPESDVVDEAAADSFVISVGDARLTATFADTDAARALAEQLQASPVSLTLHAYGGFEKVGPLPWGLPASDEQITTRPGDVMLYEGNRLTIFTASNSWAYTPLGHIENATSELLAEVLGDGDVEVTLSMR